MLLALFVTACLHGIKTNGTAPPASIKIVSYAPADEVQHVGVLSDFHIKVESEVAPEVLSTFKASL